MKILVVSANAFSTVLNNGKTYEQIFSKFRPDELCQLYTRPQDNSHSDFEFCSSYYSVSESDIINRICMRSKRCGGEINKNVGNDGSFEEIFIKYKDGKLKYIGILRDALWKTGVWKTKELKKWLHRQKPDMIFYVAGGVSHIYDIAGWASKELGRIPMAIYYTDDYFLHPIHKSFLSKLQHLRARRFYPKYIGKASLRFCIGEQMAKEYSEHFGVKFYPIMSMVDYLPFSPKEMTKSSKPVISYLGGLHLNRWKMIAQLSSYIKDLATVKVYTLANLTPEITAAFCQAGVCFCGGLTDGRGVQSAINQADMLLHVESDDLFNRSLTRLSVSTKIPEYLISSRPVIGYGPTEVASLRLLSDHELCVVISSDSDEKAVHGSVQYLIENCDYQEKLVRRAYQYALDNFDKNKIASDFREKMLDCIASIQ